MAYALEGVATEDCKIYVINVSDDSIEKVESVVAGAYQLDYLDEQDVHVFAVADDTSKGIVSYSNVQAQYVLNDYNATFAIATGHDDGMSQTYGGGSYDSTVNRVYIGGNYSRYSILRFTNVSIPQGAQIETGTLKLRSGDNRPVTQTCNIKAIDEDNSPQRTGTPTWQPSAWDALAQTTAVVPATFSALADNALWESDNIATIVQEIVNRPGWVTGSAMTIIFRDHSAVSGSYQYFASYDHATYDEPRLYVAWRA